MPLTNVRPYGVGEKRTTPKVIGTAGCFLDGLGELFAIFPAFHRGRVVSRIFRTFRLAERDPALAHAVMAPLICWSFSNSMFRYRLVDHAVPAMWRSLAAA